MMEWWYYNTFPKEAWKWNYYWTEQMALFEVKPLPFWTCKIKQSTAYGKMRREEWESLNATME